MQANNSDYNNTSFNKFRRNLTVQELYANLSIQTKIYFLCRSQEEKKEKKKLDSCADRPDMTHDF